MMSFPSPTWCTAFSSPDSSMVFFIRKISSDRVFRVSLMFFRARRALICDMSIKTRRSWGLPIFTAKLIKLRNVLVMNKLGLRRDHEWVLYGEKGLESGRTYISPFMASPNSSSLSSTSLSKEYPRPPCPINSSAVRPIQWRMSTSRVPSWTWLAIASLNWNEMFSFRCQIIIA